MKKILTALGIFLATSAVAEDDNWHNGKYLALCYNDPFEDEYFSEDKLLWMEIDRDKNTMTVRSVKKGTDKKVVAEIILFEKNAVWAETELKDLKTSITRSAFRYQISRPKLRVTKIDYVNVAMDSELYKCKEYDDIDIPSRD